jgi:hypothetical protein
VQDKKRRLANAVDALRTQVTEASIGRDAKQCELNTLKIEEEINQSEIKYLQGYEPSALKQFLADVPLSEETRPLVERLQNLRSDSMLMELGKSQELIDFLKAQISERAQLQKELQAKQQ